MALQLLLGILESHTENKMSIISLDNTFGTSVNNLYCLTCFFCYLFEKCCSSVQLSAEQHGDVRFGEERKDGILSIHLPQLAVAFFFSFFLPRALIFGIVMNSSIQLETIFKSLTIQWFWKLHIQKTSFLWIFKCTWNPNSKLNHVFVWIF